VGYGIFLLVYRGYSGNPGNPSENGLYNDANAAINYLEKKGTPTSQMVLVGESLGAGVAVDIAAKHKVAALILLAPFSSLTRLSQWHYVFIPAKLILKDRFDSLSKIKQVNAPLLIIHGTEDKIVPIKFGKELFAAANKPKEFEAVAGAHHNDLYDYGVQKKIIDFLQSKKEN